MSTAGAETLFECAASGGVVGRLVLPAVLDYACPRIALAGAVGEYADVSAPALVAGPAEGGVGALARLDRDKRSCRRSRRAEEAFWSLLCDATGVVVTRTACTGRHRDDRTLDLGEDLLSAGAERRHLGAPLSGERDAGLDEVLAAYPDLEGENVREAMPYAARAVRERELPLVVSS